MYSVVMYVKKNLLTLFFFFFFIIVLNLFFYSIITISLYKFLCYDASNNTFLQTSLLNKNVFVLFSLCDNKYVFNMLSSDSYQFLYTYLLFDVSSFIFLLPFNGDNVIHFFFDDFFLTSSSLYDFVFLNFYIRSSNLNWVYTITLQKTIILNWNETSLFFFRVYNPSHYLIKLITLYMIYPNELSLYINKIQCFCFNVMYLFPMELVDLPVLLYILPFGSYCFKYFLSNVIIYYVVFLT